MITDNGMEHNHTFDELMEREEREALLKGLRRQRSGWLRRRRIRRGALASAFVCALAMVPVFGLKASNPDYDGVRCNRSSFAENHWVAVAGNILTRSNNDIGL